MGMMGKRLVEDLATTILVMVVQELVEDVLTGIVVLDLMVILLGIPLEQEPPTIEFVKIGKQELIDAHVDLLLKFVFALHLFFQVLFFFFPPLLKSFFFWKQQSSNKNEKKMA
jgi:hypothetical protein